MGQPITVLSTTVEAGVAAFHTDRAITGQDGAVFASGEDAADTGTIPGDLAAKLFESDEAINHVFIASNQVVVGRQDVWDEASLAAAAEIVTTFFVFY
jgi:hypothetical protein